MAFSTSLVLMSMVCCLIVNAAGENLRPISSDASSNRQPRQMYVMPPPQLGYSYYNPYGGQVIMPSAGGFYPYQLTGWPYPSGESVFAESAMMERGSRDSIIIISGDLECLSDKVDKDGLGPCKKTSGGRRGSISIKLSKALQTAVVGIVRPSSERITLRCSEMTAVSAFTKTGKINDKSVVRTETGVLQLVVSSTGDNAVMKCTW